MLPDIIGYKLETGKEVLLLNGFSNVNVTVTKSPFNPENSTAGNCRILRAEDTGDHTVELLVCYM